MDSFSYSLSSAEVIQPPCSLYHALELRLTDITSSDQEEVNPPFYKSRHLQISQDCVLSRREVRNRVYGALWYSGINLSDSDYVKIVSCMYRGGDAGGSVFYVVAHVSRSRKEDACDERDSDERMIFDDANSKEVNCPICLDDLKGAGLTSNMIRTRRCCSQLFHRHCLQKWMSNKKNCPMCRAALCIEL